MADHLAGDVTGQVTGLLPAQRSRHMTHVGDVMSERVLSLPPSATAAEAARLMRDEHVGAIVVGGESSLVLGLVTDRDLVLRVIGADLDPTTTRLDRVCTTQLICVEPRTPTWKALRLMREHLIRRLPVVDRDGRAVGMVSLGDLAITHEPTTALADISAEPPADGA